MGTSLKLFSDSTLVNFSVTVHFIRFILTKKVTAKPLNSVSGRSVSSFVRLRVLHAFRLLNNAGQTVLISYTT
jgi:hypothetical protein